MVRRKIKIKRIENATTRQVTFSKRRGGLLKKAHDLSVLCDAEVGVIIFSSKGKLFQFASPSMGTVLERYIKMHGDSETPNTSNSSNDAKTDRLNEFIEKSKALQSNFFGDNLEQLSVRDLIYLEQQIHNNLRHIHRKKDELLFEQLQDIKEKVNETGRTTNVNSSILEQLFDFCASEITGFRNSGGQGGSEHCCPQEAAWANALLSIRADTSEQTSEGRRSIITEDLNHQLL